MNNAGFGQAQQKRAIVVIPPLFSPAAPVWEAAWLSELSASLAVSAAVIDSNGRFMAQRLLSPDYLNRCLEEVRRAGEDGRFWEVPEWGAAVLDQIKNQPQLWQDRLAVLAPALDTVRGEDFYEPRRALPALAEMTSALALVSLAHYPSRLTWEGLSAPGAGDWSTALAFCCLEENPANPFESFFAQGIIPSLEISSGDFLLIPAANAGQSLAALTLARLCRSMPDAGRVIILSDQLHAAFPENTEPELWDDLLPLTGRQALWDLLREAGLGVQPASSKEPQVTGLVREMPTVPAPVLAWPGPGGENILDWDALGQAAIECGAQGVMINIPWSLMDQGELPLASDRVPPWSVLSGPAAPPSPQALEAMAKAGLSMIVWERPPADDQWDFPAMRRSLLAAAKLDIWSHVRMPSRIEAGPPAGLAAFLLDNPNLGLSWSCLRDMGPFRAAEEAQLSRVQDPDQASELPGLPPLEGRPAWQGLDHPAQILLLLTKLGRRGLLRWRADEAGEAWRLGERLEFFYQRPDELPPGRLDEIARLIAQGGQARLEWLGGNLQRAFLIGYVMEAGSLAATYSLKTPRPQYVKMIQEHCGVDITGYLERGYLSVRPEYRGMEFTGELGTGLTKRSEGRRMFVVAGMDNQAVIKWCKIKGNTLVAAYYSERLGKDAGLWLSPVEPAAVKSAPVKPEDTSA